MSAIPPSLIAFESQLEAAIRRRRRRQPLRFAVRGAVVTVALAAVAFGVVNLMPSSGASAVARAAAALATPDDSILHVVLVSDRSNADGTTAAMRIETWEESAAPYDRREISTAGERRLELATTNGTLELYDSQTNTIYTQPAADVPPSKIAKEGPQPPSSTDGDRYRAKILALLRSGAAHEDGRLSLDGRDAIRIVSTDGSMTLFVDADTYEPIEWRVSEGASTETTRFTTYERLPASSASFLSLAAQHPGATLDRNPADFEAAAKRLSGKAGAYNDTTRKP